MNKNNKLLILFFIFIVFISADYIYINNQLAAIGNINQILSLSENKTASESHVIKIGDNQYEISVPENSTVFDLMNLLAARGDISFQGNDSSGFGFFVDEINGIKNDGTKNTYWMYYINDKSADVGISGYVLKPGDKITWKYETPQF